MRFIEGLIASRRTSSVLPTILDGLREPRICRRPKHRFEKFDASTLAIAESMLPPLWATDSINRKHKRSAFELRPPIPAL